MLIKLLGEDYPAALQTFYRQLAGLLVLLPMILRNPRAAFHTTRPGMLLFRALAGTIGMILGVLRLSEVAARRCERAVVHAHAVARAAGGVRAEGEASDRAASLRRPSAFSAHC